MLLAVSLLHDPVRRERILAWAHPKEYKLGTGMQADHAMLAFGSGGWTGLGLGNSRQKLGYLTFHNTDFILPIIGEELGLAATLLVVAAFAAMVVSGFYIASRSSDTFGTLLAAGITLMIGLQAAINIGVVTGVLPNKGIPLPFISYGGSNLLIMLASVGLLLSVARRARPAPVPALAHEELTSPQMS
jgi:cell division protein FtsW